MICRKTYTGIITALYMINAPGRWSEMAEAIAEGRPNRASAKMAYHVLDTIDQIMKSAETGAFEKVPSTCERPEAMPNS